MADLTHHRGPWQRKFAELARALSLRLKNDSGYAMNKIILYIFSKTKLGKVLDGKKTILGAAFVLLSALLQAAEQIAPMFPNVPWVAQAAEQLGHILKAAEPYLNDLGLGLISVGLLHKNAKAGQR